MTRRGGRGLSAALSIVLLAAAVAVAGCGGGGAKDGGGVDPKAYAAEVSAISTSTGDRLAALSDRADYRQADAAAQSTREFASAIRQAARELRRAKPPASVAGLHASLVKLYDQTATALDQLAEQFAAARDPVELAARAQDLSTAVQRYATQEQELRSGIERALAQPTTPAN